MLWEKLGMTLVGLLLVMAALRLGGRRLGGLLAGLPTITAPTLAWTAVEHGSGFAVQAAIGSVASCAAGALFAWAYVCASRRLAAAGALACGLAAAGLAAVPALSASHDLVAAASLALLVTCLAWRTLPAGENAPAAAHPPRPGLPALQMAGIATVLTVAVSTIGPWFGPYATGLLASLPLISAPLAVAEHAGSGHHASTEFLRGYVKGLFGKAAFGVVFVLLAPPAGTLPALALATAVTGLLSLYPGPRRRAPPA